jgi:hypothetical protein
MTKILCSLFALLALMFSSCKKEGCLGQDANCRVPSPCQKYQPTQSGSPALLKVGALSNKSQRSGGINALGAVGDVKLSNQFLEATISQIGNQNYLDPNGGSILDLTPVTNGKANADQVNNIFQVVGILPRDSAFYTSLEIIDESPERVAVQVKGTLDGQPNIPIATLYELRAGDHGLRVRTEVLNASTNAQTFSLVDAFYWSGRESLPFAPGEGAGFVNKPFGLTTINAAYRLFPFLATLPVSSDAEASSAISSVSCTENALEGFNSDQISAAGLPRTIVEPRGYLVFERFIAVESAANGISKAVGDALDVRQQVLGEKQVTLTGTVKSTGTLGTLQGASILVSEGALSTEVAKRIPWSQVTPDSTGKFSVQVPAGKPLVLEVHAFGQKRIEREFAGPESTLDVGELLLPASTKANFTVKEAGVFTGLNAEIFLIPADGVDAEPLKGTLHGRFASCAPWLGPPPGASPACNRVLVRNGLASAEVPFGKYDVYAFHGPFWSLGKQTVDFTSEKTVNFELTNLQAKPMGMLAADMHVHGAKSFDSSIPEYDRVLSFAASNLDVIVATDHDVVYDYAAALKQLSLDSNMSAVVGVETTGHIPFLSVPGYGFPLVIGHYNMWPLRYDPSLPRNGGPFDERVEPGELFERTKPLFTGTPIIEMNHPWADAEFGRDLGFPRAILLDLTRDLPTSDDGTRQFYLVKKPGTASFTNDAHHAQEVMNGSDNSQYLQYREFWFYMLNQGKLRTGTANSDSHSLVDSTVGVPLNLVSTSTSAGPTFDVNVFNQAIRDGNILGTNGPVIEATIDAASGSSGYSLKPLKVSSGAKLKVKVSSAPWIPVKEVRFVVNGKVAKVMSTGAVLEDTTATVLRQRAILEVSVSELLAGVSGDAWIVVEAGDPLRAVSDLGGGLDDAKDGMPDTTDNNGDGTIDSSDVKEGQKIGPFENPPVPKRTEVGYDFGALFGAAPTAFTNPFVIDVNGDGVFSAPGVKGGRP